jgi:hypothetical protein
MTTLSDSNAVRGEVRAVTGLGPNAVQECPSPARLKTHRAHGQVCPTCEPEAEWKTRCPSCRCRVTAVGTRILAHPARRNGWVVQCPGTRATAVPQLVDRTVRPVVAPPNRLQRALKLIEAGRAAS